MESSWILSFISAPSIRRRPRDRSVASTIACIHAKPRLCAPFVRVFDPFYLNHSRRFSTLAARRGRAAPPRDEKGKRSATNKHGPVLTSYGGPFNGARYASTALQWVPENNEIPTKIFVILNNIAFTSSSRPAPSLTPTRYPYAWTWFQRDRNGFPPPFSLTLSLASRHYGRPFLFRPRRFPGPVRRTKDSAWFSDGWTSEPKRIKDLFANRRRRIARS